MARRLNWLFCLMFGLLLACPANLLAQQAEVQSQQEKQTQDQKAKDKQKDKDDQKADEKPDEAAEGDKPAKAEEGEEKESTKFLRIVRDDSGTPIAMETAVVRYKGKAGKRDGLTVDLIGAVHVGDSSYYNQLNALFTKYDALLYELVAPEGTVITKDTPRGTSPISALQQGIKNVLELDFQLDEIDYTADNFVHADMTPKEFSKSMKDRGEGFFQIFLRAMKQSMMQANSGNAPSDVELLMALFSKDRALKMKRLMSAQFEDLEGAMNLFNGPDGSTLITERNKKALAVLDREIKDGKTNLGIFYGAGHMPDFEERLDKMGFERGEVVWVKAWTMEDPKAMKKADSKDEDDDQ